MQAVAAFGTCLIDDYATALGYTPDAAPGIWERHGDETHVRPLLKFILCVVGTVFGAGIVQLVQLAVGRHDPRTQLRLARDDFLERRDKVAQWDSLLSKPQLSHVVPQLLPRPVGRQAAAGRPTSKQRL